MKESESQHNNALYHSNITTQTDSYCKNYTHTATSATL